MDRIETKFRVFKIIDSCQTLDQIETVQNWVGRTLLNKDDRWECYKYAVMHRMKLFKTDLLSIFKDL